ncbi:hypothetical protein DKX38_018614 [Salix brachista]|uniref:Secreted protein n=1 Tax=Salix brachista TaxID=2182728 RepID=A0A5N5KNH5_9ROSI|nr:hypothetical protein DKX38_018614 [Salix brachista]
MLYALLFFPSVLLPVSVLELLTLISNGQGFIFGPSRSGRERILFHLPLPQNNEIHHNPPTWSDKVGGLWSILLFWGSGKWNNIRSRPDLLPYPAALSVDLLDLTKI